ncbi:hypothetical protein F4815DRAFT_471245 [Daldinia loculata]|nr:hypothetical protein F4815DRAFT_471245 [Daldinia loculata]
MYRTGLPVISSCNAMVSVLVFLALVGILSSHRCHRKCFCCRITLFQFHSHQGAYVPNLRIELWGRSTYFRKSGVKLLAYLIA